MTNKNIMIELLDLLKKTYPKKMLISLLIDNGFMESDFYKIGFDSYDIDSGVKYNFTGK
jgi:hypothetical protein